MYLKVTKAVLVSACLARSYSTSVKYAILIQSRTGKQQRPGTHGLLTQVHTGVYIRVITMVISHAHSLDAAIHKHGIHVFRAVDNLDPVSRVQEHGVCLC